MYFSCWIQKYFNHFRAALLPPPNPPPRHSPYAIFYLTSHLSPFPTSTLSPQASFVCPFCRLRTFPHATHSCFVTVCWGQRACTLPRLWLQLPQSKRMTAAPPHPSPPSPTHTLGHVNSSSHQCRLWTYPAVTCIYIIIHNIQLNVNSVWNTVFWWCNNLKNFP